MNTPTSAVLDQLENQLKELVKKTHQLQQIKISLETTVLESQSKLKKKQDDAKLWKEKYEALKAIQGMKSGNKAAKKRTLHHIDALINEIDNCIVQIKIGD